MVLLLWGSLFCLTPDRRPSVHPPSVILRWDVFAELDNKTQQMRLILVILYSRYKSYSHAAVSILSFYGFWCWGFEDIVETVVGGEKPRRIRIGRRR